MVHYYVSRIDYCPHPPKACMNCGRTGIVRHVVIAQTGPTPENVSPKDNLLCLACETLMVITTE